MSRILVVDDDDDFRSLLRRAVERMGHEPMEAAHGRAALKVLESAPMDLIITDLIMPEMDGVELIQAVRREYPGLKIIAMSGGGRIGPESYLALAKTLGAHKILTKPFTIQVLLAAIQELIG